MVFVRPLCLAQDKGKHPLPQEAAGRAQHNGHTLLQIPSLRFSKPSIVFGLGLGNGKFWLNHVTFSLSAQPHRWPGAVSSSWGLISAPTILYLSTGNLVRLSNSTGSPLNTLPQSGSPGPFPPTPQPQLWPWPFLPCDAPVATQLVLWPSSSVPLLCSPWCGQAGPALKSMRQSCHFPLIK